MQVLDTLQVHWYCILHMMYSRTSPVYILRVIEKACIYDTKHVPYVPLINVLHIYMALVG
jgi:hypothetical protein